MKPLLVMLAGSNGAGKSTFYETYLSHLGLPFLNADILAKQLNIDSYTAARRVAALREFHIQQKKGFITETVLSDPVGEKVQFLKKSAEAGFDVSLIFIGIDSVQLSKDRVRTRVSAGGHDVPEEKLESRYARTLKNLERAIELLPRVVIYDNSYHANPYQLVAEFREGVLYTQPAKSVPIWAKALLNA